MTLCHTNYHQYIDYSSKSHLDQYLHCHRNSDSMKACLEIVRADLENKRIEDIFELGSATGGVPATPCSGCNF